MNDVIEMPANTESSEDKSLPLNPSTTPISKGHIGEQLMLARTYQQLSIEQVAGQLKWSARQIAEIEAGNYRVLPDPSSLRGFVRTYAKILKLDAAPLLEELSIESSKPAANMIDRPKLDMPFSKRRMPWLGRQNNRSQYILGGLFLACVFIVVAVVYRTEVQGVFSNVALDDSAATISQSPAADQKAEKPIMADTSFIAARAGAPEEGSSENRRNSFIEPTKTESVSTVESKPEVVAAPFNKSSPVVIPVVSTETKSQDANAGSNIDPKTALVMDFKKETWVRITRANGTVVVSHIYKAGDQEVIGMAEPISMVIGNVAGVDVKLRGEPFPLQAPKGSNVISLNVK